MTDASAFDPARVARATRFDIAVAALAAIVTLPLERVRYGSAPAASSSWPPWLTGVAIVAVVAAIGPLCIATVIGYGRSSRLTRDVPRTTVRLVLCAAITSWVVAVLLPLARLGPSLAQLAALSVLLPAGWMVTRLLTRPRAAERVVVLGSGQVAQRLLELSRRHAEQRFTVVGRLDDHPLPDREGAPLLLGDLGLLPGLLADGAVDRVIVGFSFESDARLVEVLRRCDEYVVPVDVVPRLFEFMGSAPRAYDIDGMPILSVVGPPPAAAAMVAKRAFDALVAAVALLAVAPVLAVIAVAIKLADGGEVLFRQERVGMRGRRFTILKFRTMVADADAVGLERIAGLRDGRLSIDDAVSALKAERDPRITRLGGVLRRTSLDELPQLVNVLRGDMSVVGPRPLRPFETDALHGWHHRRLLVRPGITGLWQATGRSDALWGERMELDYAYVRHWSLRADLKIIARTIPALSARRGAR
ncbi:MAG: hypothetical protein V7607_745 [Solirubrobacteraceae bacterium]